MELAKTLERFQKLECFKNENESVANKSFAPNFIFFNKKKGIRQAQITFDKEKWLWRTSIWHLLGAPIDPNQFNDEKVIGL